MKQIYNQSNALKNYQEKCETYPNLTDEETRRLAEEAQHGNKDAYDKLFLSYAKYVFNILSYFYNIEHQRQELEDLVQEGMLGLMTAINKYRTTDEAKFCTYSAYWIRKMISAKIMANTNSCIHRPEKRIRRTATIINASAEYELVHGRKPNFETLAALTGETVDFIKSVLNDQLLNVTSLDEPTTIGDLNGESLSIKEVIPDRDVNVEEFVIGKVHDEEYKKLLFVIFTDSTERKILDLLMENDKRSHRDIAEQIGCSRQNISKKIARIKKVMRDSGYYLPEDEE